MKSHLQKIRTMIVVSTWLSVTVAAQHPATGQTKELRQSVKLDVNQAAMADDHRIVGGRWIVASDKTGGDQPGWVYWNLPADFPAGRYRVTFAGMVDRYPSPWISIQDLEPYRIDLRKPDRQEGKVVHAFTFPDPTDRPRESGFEHHAFGKPLKVQRRVSDRPVMLWPGTKLIIRTRYPQVMVGDVQLEPIEPWADLNVEIASAAPFHMFDDRTPVQFVMKIENPTANPWVGQLSATWTDASKGEPAIEQRDIRLAPAASGKIRLTRDVPYGAYQLDLRLEHHSGHVVTQRRRSFTMSPFIDARQLPESWPFGFHKRPVEPAVPQVGIKWIRTFWGWDEMEPDAKGAYDWSEMDELVALARKNNQSILWVCYTVPGWASRNPGQTSDMPAKMSDFEDFLEAFWKRYAPEGKPDVIRAVEVWNEPNVNAMKHLSAADLVGFARKIKASVDEHAPGVKVVGISESGGKHTAYVNRLLDAGMGKTIDVASLHIYEVGTPRGHVSIESKIKAMQQALREHGNQMPLWNTESGISQSIRRADGTSWTQEQLNALFADSPGFDPDQPHRLGMFWRSASERVGAANMVRSVAQQLSLGVEKVFWFRWQAGYWGWVQDWRIDGNPVPRLAVPVHAVMAQMFRDYGSRSTGSMNIASPHPAYAIHAYRFEGPQGRMIIAFAHGVEERSGATDAIGASAETNEAEDAQTVGESTHHRLLRTQPMAPLAVALPTGSGIVRAADLLGQPLPRESSDGRTRVNLTDEPIYILMPKP